MYRQRAGSIEPALFLFRGIPQNISALSVPENTGRRRLYKTVRLSGSCSGRPFSGRAAFRSLQNKTESLRI
jgi:hypothetical protein